MFQSTHPHGVRRDFDIDLHSLIPVFQSTHPHGVRPNNAQSIANDKAFQSTHPHGVRPSCIMTSPSLSVFQSTHPHGVRLGINHFENIIYVVSIHAPTRGATIILYNVSSCLTFQSTHPHGVRQEYTGGYRRL